MGIRDRVMDRIGTPPRVYIVRMRDVPLIDSSGAARFREFINHATRHHATVVVSGLQRMPRRTLIAMHILHPGDNVHLVSDFTAAVQLANRLIARKPIASEPPATD